MRRRIVRRMTGLLMALAFCGIGALEAEPAGDAIRVGHDLANLGWRDMLFGSRPPNRFIGHEDGRIEVLSERSASLLYLPLRVDPAQSPCLNWRWRVDRSMAATDLARRGEDDRPLAIYVAFPYQAREASLSERVKRLLVEQIEGPDAPGRVLVYVWGGLGLRGDTVMSPHLGSAAVMRILRPGDSPLGEWRSEQVDVVDDYRRAFGQAPPFTMHVAIGADSDDTGSASAGMVQGLAFGACR